MTRHSRLLPCLLLFATAHIAAQGPQPVALAKATAVSRVRFTEVGGLVELGNGRVLVADPTEGAVVLLDLATGRSADVARKGSGPREYRRIGHVLRRRDGGAMLVDFMQFRLLPVGPEGSIGDAVPYPRSLGYSLAAIDAQGRYYADLFQFRGQPRGVSDTMLIVRWDPRRDVIDTIGGYDAGVSKVTGGSDQAVEAYPAIDHWSVFPDGTLAVLDATRYRVTVRHGTPTARTIQLPWQPVRFTEADRTAHQEYAAAHPPIPMGGASAKAPRPIDFAYPRTFPAFVRDHVWLDLAGRIWIEKSRPAADAVAVFDVVDEAGTVLGRVALPPGGQLAGFGRASVYVAMPNDDDELAIQRHPMPTLGGR